MIDIRKNQTKGYLKILLVSLGLVSYGSWAQVRPNIILIMADDMGYSDLGCMGSEIPTPHLDKLAKKGLLMTQFYNTGRCCPTRASLLTGLYPHQAGMGDMDDNRGLPAYQGQLKSNTLTIAEVLKKGGYHTGISGKWHVGNAPQVQPLQRGFDEQFLIKGGGGMYFYPARINRSLMVDSQSFVPDSSSFYSTDAINDYAVKFVDKHQNEPYFLYVAHVAPHFPLQAKKADIEKFRNKYKAGFEVIQNNRFAKMKALGLVPANETLPPNDLKVIWEKLTQAEKDTLSLKMATYAAQIWCMDEGIGRIVAQLEKTGQLDRTLILFLSDNGGEATEVKPVAGANDWVGDRHNWTSYGKQWATVSNTPFRKHKMYVHEGGTRSPLIVHFPKLISKHRQETQVGHVIDILPTLMDITGAKYPSISTSGEAAISLEGHSLVPFWAGKKTTKTTLLGWEHEGNRAFRQGDWKLVSSFLDNKWELYHLKEDPFEKNDLSLKNPQKSQEMASLYAQWAKRVGVEEWNKMKKTN